jgi:hypothetical protein
MDIKALIKPFLMRQNQQWHLNSFFWERCMDFIT